jgi:sortase A
MTVLQSPPPGAPSTPGGVGSIGTVPSSAQLQAPGGRPTASRLVASAAILILGAALLGFGVWIAFGSRLYYDRVQYDAYANFRVELGQAIAPTGPTETDASGRQKLLASGTPVALLSIPEVGLNAVVLEGTSSEVLEGGPGHLRDTQLPGQIGYSEIFGRRTAYGGPFARLSSLSPGQVFTVTTGQGVTKYRVLDLRRAGDVVPPLTAGAGRLVLVTADGPPFAPTGVLRVDANTIGPPKPAPTMVISSSDVGSSELVFGTESIAWVPLVLWGQGLVLAATGVSWLGSRWGRWQTWIVAVPVLGYFGLEVAGQITRLLPNLM